MPSRKSRLIISLKIISIDKPGQIGKIGQILGNYNANILSIGIEHTENKLIAINMAVALESSDFTLEIVNSLENLEGVVEVFQYN